MRKFLLFLTLQTLYPLIGFTQNEKNIWYFGRQAGIDFSIGFPVVLTNGAMFTDEAAAVMNDSAGNLLFYTNSVNVWNSNHQIMENGENLMGCESASQVIIVPKPCIEDSLYFVFTVGCVEYNLFANGLRYSIIDLKYNNGLGKVVEKNILLHDSVTEKITAITHANGHDFWVLAHEWGNNNFIEYLVNCNGLNNTPIIISVGQTQTGQSMSAKCGVLKPSPNGQKLAMTAGTIFELFDFNNLTGNIYNCKSLLYDTVGGGVLYGVAFSKDNTKLYINRSAFPHVALFQYNLVSDTISDIINSKTIIFNDTISTTQQFLTMGVMTLASDGKIYISHYTLGNGMGDSLLGVINYPDSLGLLCSYNHMGFNLAGRNSSLSLPGFIETPFNYIHCYDYINEESLNEYNVNNFPNPFNQTTTLFLNKMSLPFDLKLYDILGTDVTSLAKISIESILNNMSIKIDRNNLGNGIYLFRIKAKNKTYSMKLIIN